ncbi:low-density lipoprotein receptor-related protein 6 [Caerostris extrusa]|uniref:Low-density lipoprotein receptor-related protein 6 n=1 Tax=Caerostris extrusa TaxID=172846 RepID=A0AAV4XQA4_CAEEX|nr:low-density lipoprotein receptor-related protein 6 [Caerostris extrusa]
MERGSCIANYIQHMHCVELVDVCNRNGKISKKPNIIRDYNYNVRTNNFVLYSSNLGIHGLPLETRYLYSNVQVLAPISRISMAHFLDFYEGNMYWIDGSFGCIEVAHLNGSNRYVVVSGKMSKPKNTIVHPYKGLMFWCDWEVPPKIEMAALDGSQRQDFLNSSLQLVQDLAIDFEMDMLYWTDARTHTIERIHLDGTGREVVAGASIVEKPLCVAIYQNHIYWTDIQKMGGAIFRMDKNTESNIEMIREFQEDALKDIIIYHPRNVSGDNPCIRKCSEGICEDEGTVWDLICASTEEILHTRVPALMDSWLKMDTLAKRMK